MAPKNAKRGLGKGIDSLIPAKVAPSKAKETKEAEVPVEGQVTKVKITKIEPNRKQPRKTFDEDKLLELADSIKQYGIIEPLTVVDRGEHYEIVGGERRWRAAQKLGLKEVPVIIRNLTEQEIAEISALPGKDALYAKVLGTMIAPITGLAVCLGQILEQMGGSVGAPEAEAAE